MFLEIASQQLVAVLLLTFRCMSTESLRGLMTTSTESQVDLFFVSPIICIAAKFGEACQQQVFWRAGLAGVVVRFPAAGMAGLGWAGRFFGPSRPVAGGVWDRSNRSYGTYGVPGIYEQAWGLGVVCFFWGSGAGERQSCWCWGLGLRGVALGLRGLFCCCAWGCGGYRTYGSYGSHGTYEKQLGG